MMDNLELYNKVCEVPKNALKAFNNGSFKGTDINPMWRIKTLTKEFGVCGVGWYYEVIDRWSENGDDGKVCVFILVNLFIRNDGEWSKPIQGLGGNMLINKFAKGYKTSDEAYKMALTDALSIACKALGIGANVWWKEEQTKYTNTQPQETIKSITLNETDALYKLAHKKGISDEMINQTLKENYNCTDPLKLSRTNYQIIIAKLNIKKDVNQ